MRFRPPLCPHSDCPSRDGGPRRYHSKGRYLRACDGRWVQRFLCRECLRSFSVQTFRLDYRLRKPRIAGELLGLLVSKVTHRQAARILGCNRKTVAHRLLMLGDHCKRFHEKRLELARARGGLVGRFQLDELETYEHSRRLCPVTMPVLIERKSYFVVDLETAALPCRGGLSEKDRAKKLERERRFGVRKSGSREAVTKCFERLAEVASLDSRVAVQTDFKATYRRLLRKILGDRAAHERCSSTAKRDYENPLFPINHTLAMLRDGISRLVRRTWAASKKKENLAHHAWIWATWRNYVRGITNKSPQVTPAMAIGVESTKWRPSQILAWRILDGSARAQPTGPASKVGGPRPRARPS